MFVLVMSSLLGALVGISLFIYYLKRGQFEDLEDVKYQMFRGEKE